MAAPHVRSLALRTMKSPHCATSHARFGVNSRSHHAPRTRPRLELLGFLETRNQLPDSPLGLNNNVREPALEEVAKLSCNMDSVIIGVFL